jgi:glycosyltransferase involved in cell wall biosynthesis
MYFRIPKLHTYHGHLLNDPHFSRLQISMIIYFEKFLSKFTRQLIVTGKQVQTDLEAKGVGTPSKFLSIPGQTNISDLVPREIARVKLGLSSEFTVLWVARVVSVKNPKLLLEVAKRMPDCEFLMAGDGEELESIRSLAPNNIRILGFVDVKEILTAGDVFLSTSLNEGIPYSILEAQSINLPVVAVRAGALAEIVKNGVNGYLVDSNADEIVDRLESLRASPELIESMKSKSRAISKNSNSVISFSEKHLELYREVLNRN